MSLEVVRRIVCDSSEVCIASIRIGMGETTQQARARAAQLGWTGNRTRTVRDYCPEHSLR